MLFSYSSSVLLNIIRLHKLWIELTVVYWLKYKISRGFFPPPQTGLRTGLFDFALLCVSNVHFIRPTCKERRRRMCDWFSKLNTVMDKKSISCSTNLFWGGNVIQTLSQTMLKWTWWVMCSVNFNSNWSRLNSLAPKTNIRNFCLHTSSCWMCLAKLIHHRYLLTAPLSFFSHYTFCLPFMFFFCVALSGRCYETLHQRYYDNGASWGRIHLRNVEQCTCVAGEISCERVRYTSKAPPLFLWPWLRLPPGFCAAL